MDVVLDKTATKSLEVAPKRRCRRFTAQDIEDIAQLNAKRLTDTEACQLLGINYFSFATWKSKEKNSVKLAESLTRARAIKLDACLEAIDEAGNDSMQIQAGKEYTKRGDWRAKAFLVERVLAPERFSDRQQPANQTNVLIGDDVAARVIALFAQSKQRQIGNITNPHEDKLLDASKPIENIEQK